MINMYVPENGFNHLPGIGYKPLKWFPKLSQHLIPMTKVMGYVAILGQPQKHLQWQHTMRTCAHHFFRPRLDLRERNRRDGIQLQLLPHPTNVVQKL